MTRFILMTAALASAVYGQGGGRGPTTAVSDIKAKYAAIKTNITQAAEQMPEAGYGFMPEGEPRSFAGWVGHVADSQARTCGGLTGNALNLGAGQMTTKADLVAAVKKSFEACDAAYDAITDANQTEPVSGGFGGPAPRLVALYDNLIHSNECYGAMAVYLRLQKLVPPSTQNMGARGGGRGKGGGGGKQN